LVTLYLGFYFARSGYKNRWANKMLNFFYFIFFIMHCYTHGYNTYTAMLLTRVIDILTLFIILRIQCNLQCCTYITYNTIQPLTLQKIQMLTLLTIQYDISSCLTMLISITYATITKVTWNKIQLLMLLETFTPWQKAYFHYSIIQAKLYWGGKLQNQVSEQCSIFHCIWSLVWSSEILGFSEKILQE